MLRKLYGALILMSCMSVIASAQTGAKPLGMVLDVQGTVTIQRGQNREPALPAELLFAGDQITTAANGKVTFSFCPPNQRYSLNADSAISVAAAEIQQTKGAPASKAAAARCTLPQVALGKRDTKHIGAMGARGYPAIPVYVGGIISTGRPRFMWGTPVPTVQEYKLTLKASGGKELWTWTGQGSEVQLPETVAELQPGNYVWELVGNAGGNKAAEQTSPFEVKPNPDVTSAARSQGISPLEMATIYENAGYYSEAAAIYRTLRAQNGNDKRFSQTLLWLYFETGLFAASNIEYEKLKAQ